MLFDVQMEVQNLVIVTLKLNPLSCLGPPNGCGGAINEEFTDYYILADEGSIVADPAMFPGMNLRWGGFANPMDWNFRTGRGEHYASLC